jgi:hypothetical protein
MSFLGVDDEAALPGTKMKETRNTMTAGATPAAHTNIVVVIVSLTTGKEMLRSTRENGR